MFENYNYVFEESIITKGVYIPVETGIKINVLPTDIYCKETVLSD